MAEIKSPLAGKFKEFDESFLRGFELQKVSCRGCSGYGNCGFKTYGLMNGKVVSVCRRTLAELVKERDGIDIEF